ncbi:class I SAM-dependent methyltransferase [Pseudonocardia spinosispora]|uniref:class I SAM-dependent methyltransferase n=1 Tax=Pseudonocardia spinosispora TaxID=103441 RepID=UPI0003FB2A44|nr:class I SAM-dependent methyltransferase [Pseudonocardia spinosispora]
MTELTYLRTIRTDYDAVAELYAELTAGSMENFPLDRALISAFADIVKAGDAGTTVADLGCGPGHITGYLHSLGLAPFGIDLTPTMIAIARRTHPGLSFDEGSMTELALPDDSVGGVLSWYSMIHTPPEQLPVVFAEFSRVLAPGGHALIGFFSGDDSLREPQEFDHKASLAYRWPVGDVAELLRAVGLVEVARLTREPGVDERFERGNLIVRGL